MWVVTIAFFFGVFVCVVVEALMADRDVARGELDNKMNTNQTLRWIVEELRQQRPARVYLYEIHCGVQQILHILQHVHPDALTPEQKAAIEKATKDLDTASTDLNTAVQSQQKEQ